MQLLPSYYTTTNTRKRKAKGKTKSLIEAEKKHEKFLNKYRGKSGGVKNKSVSSYSHPTQDVAEGSIPSLSNTIPTGTTPRKEVFEHNFTIAPAYNKGAYQVISKRDIKDIGR